MSDEDQVEKEIVMTSPAKIQDFLHDLEQTSPEKYAVVTEARQIFRTLHPQAEERFMYGGITFFANGELFGGIFVYQNHISIKFSHGHRMHDPDNLLQGNGKYRRHLKIADGTALDEETVRFFVGQA